MTYIMMYYDVFVFYDVLLCNFGNFSFLKFIIYISKNGTVS